jgi:hypothetical protein
VIIVGNEIPICYKKSIEDPFNPAVDKPFHVCDSARYGFERTDSPPMPRCAFDIAFKVMERSDLDVLGIDVIVKDNEAKLIELNSAPGIGNLSALHIWNSMQAQWG